MMKLTIATFRPTLILALIFASVCVSTSDLRAEQAVETSPSPLDTIKSQFGKRPLTRPFLLSVHLKVQPKQKASFLSAMKEATVATRKEEANVRYQLIVAANDPSQFILMEQWKTFDGLAAHFETEHLKSLLNNFETTLAEPPKIEVYFPAPIRMKAPANKKND